MLRCLLGLWLLLFSGCAVGYGIGSQSATLAAKPDNVIGSADVKKTASTAFHEFRLVDTTGVLLAALTNSARASSARAEAIENARHKPRNSDGTVTVDYEYEAFPILSGLLLDTRLRLGIGDLSTSLDGASSTDQPDNSYIGFDMRGEWYTFAPSTLPLIATISFGMYVEKYESNVEELATDVTAGVNLTYVVTPDLMATGRLQHGAAMPLIALIDSGPALVPRFEFEAGYRLHKYFSVIASTRMARDSTGSTSLVTWRAGLGIMGHFGAQTIRAD